MLDAGCEDLFLASSIQHLASGIFFIVSVETQSQLLKISHSLPERDCLLNLRNHDFARLPT
jgi:hypothetical protein